MVLTRVVGIILYVVLVFAMHAATLWALRRPRSLPNPACPRCAYSLNGAHTLQCPECGHTITVTLLERAGRRRSIGLYVMTAWENLVLAVPIWLLGRTVLELNLIAERGPNAFLPGYSLLTGTASALIVVACASVWGLLVYHAISTAKSAARRYSGQLHDQALAFVQKLTGSSS